MSGIVFTDDLETNCHDPYKYITRCKKASTPVYTGKHRLSEKVFISPGDHFVEPVERRMAQGAGFFF
jgi:hypothetical protein